MRTNKPGWAAAVAALALAVYAVTLAPGLSGGDDGELALVAEAASVAHPPGYPTWVLLGHLAAKLPIGALALRLNLFSALCGALAAAFLFLALERWTRSTLSALVGAGLFALSPLVWTWSTRTEVFALNDLCASALLWLTTRYLTERRRFDLFAFAAVFGVGLGNHQTLVLVGVPLGFACAAIAWRERSERRAVIASVGIAALSTLVLCALLPLLSAHGGLESWGELNSFDALIAHVTRRDYGSLRLAASGLVKEGTFSGELGAFAWDHSAQLLGIGVLIALWGAVVALRTRGPLRPFGVALLVAWVLCAIGFHALARFPVEEPLLRAVLARFWLLPLLVACAFAARGIADLLPRHRAVALAAIALLIAQGARSAFDIDRTHPWQQSIAEDYARAVLTELPTNAVVLTRGDLIHNALRYEPQARGVRSDVVVLDQELMTYPWYVRRAKSQFPDVAMPGERYLPNAASGFSLAQWVAANSGRPVFLAGGTKPGDDSLQGRFTRVPHGLTEQLVDARDPNLPARLRAAGAEADVVKASAFGGDARAASDDPWHAAFVDEYWEARHRPALALLREGMARSDPSLLQASVNGYQRLMREHPSPPAAYFKNLGLACWRAHDPKCAREAFSGYLQRAPADDADRAAITQALQGSLDAP